MFIFFIEVLDEFIDLFYYLVIVSTCLNIKIKILYGNISTFKQALSYYFLTPAFER